MNQYKTLAELEAEDQEGFRNPVRSQKERAISEHRRKAMQTKEAEKYDRIVEHTPFNDYGFID
jgi:hypothetical protein